MRKLIILLMILMFCLPFVTSCRQSAPLAPEEPYAILLLPQDGETLASGDVQVKVYLQNFKIVSDTNRPNNISEGHIIYYLDADVPIAAGNLATTEPGTCAISNDTSYVWDNVPAGQHTFTIQLVNNDNTPLYPPVAVRANVTVVNH